MPLARRTLALALTVLLAACSEERAAPLPAPDAGEPVACPEGTRPRADGGCEPILPADACPAGTRAAVGEEGCLAVGWTDCPTTFEPAPDGWGCVEVRPAQDCPAGTRPALGSRDCLPVGPAACPEGFEPAADGWGCAEILPAERCDGATLEVLGSRTCQPLGDCAAPFPPADATHFVDPRFEDAELDATHFRTLTDALAAAPEGAVVAIEEGVYFETVRPAVSLTLVGRCAEKVIVDGTGTTKIGLLAREGDTVRASGLTLQNWTYGAAVWAGRLELSDSLLVSNKAFGLFSDDRSGAGSVASLSRCAIRDTLPDAEGGWGYGVAANKGGRVDLDQVEVARSRAVAVLSSGVSGIGAASHAQVRRSVLRDTAEARSGGAALLAGLTATLEVSDSAVLSNLGAGVHVLDGAATVRGSVVRDTRLDGGTGYGAAVEGGNLILEASTLRDNATGGVIAWGAASQVVVERCAVVGSGATGDPSGITASEGAQVRASGCAVVGAGNVALAALDPGSLLAATGSLARETRAGDWAGAGGLAQAGGRLELEASALVDSVGVGVAVLAGSAKLTDTLVLRVAPATDDETLAGGLKVEDGGRAEVSRCAFVESSEAGLVVDSQAAPGTELTISESLVRATRPNAGGRYGAGLLVLGGAKVGLESCLLRENREIAVFVGTGAELQASRLVVSGTLANADGRWGFGVDVGGGALALRDSALIDNRVAALALGASGASSATVERSLLAGTSADVNGAHGLGILGSLGSIATVADSEVRDNAAIGLLFDSGAATVARSIVRNHPVGVHVQHGSTLIERGQVPEAPEPGQIIFDSHTVFVDNEARVGLGLVPLPEPPM